MGKASSCPPHVQFLPGAVCDNVFYCKFLKKLKFICLIFHWKFFLEQFLNQGSRATGEALPELIFAALASAQLPTFPSESLPFAAHPSIKP